MAAQHDVGGVGPRQDADKPVEVVARDKRGFPVGRIGTDTGRRGPGIIHRYAGRRVVRIHLGLTHQPFGKVRVEPVDEDEDLALVLRLAGKLGIDRPDESGFVGDRTVGDHKEVGLRIGCAAREGHGAGLAHGRDRDLGFGKAHARGDAAGKDRRIGGRHAAGRDQDRADITHGGRHRIDNDTAAWRACGQHG